MVKYSEIREKIEIKPLKDDNNLQAYTTHYLHNIGNGESFYFSEPAMEYLVNYDDVFSSVEQKKIEFKWDIPFPPPKKPKFKFIDLFAGIGGIRLAYQNAGGKCVFSSEYNKFAKVTYEANFGEVPFGDITKIDEKQIPDHDVLWQVFLVSLFQLPVCQKKTALVKNTGFLTKPRVPCSLTLPVF